MSKEAIVQKIISDAEIKANSFIEEQSAKADEIIADAAEKCKNYYYNSRLETDRAADDIAVRAKTVAELDVKKLQLAAKKKVLDGVFEGALKKLASLDNASMKKLLLGMLSEAEDGDTVTVGKRQKDVLTKEDVNEFANRRNVKLTVSDECGEFDGLVISGGGVDKNLTFEVEIAMLRESLETKIAKEIFG